VALVNALAIVALFTAQAFHTHSADPISTSEANCTMCILAHSNTAPMPLLSAVLVVPEPQSILQTNFDNFRIKSQNTSSVQSIRPPPQA